MALKLPLHPYSTIKSLRTEVVFYFIPSTTEQCFACVRRAFVALTGEICSSVGCLPTQVRALDRDRNSRPFREQSEVLTTDPHRPGQSDIL